jgi:hypothetical protein
MPVESKVEGKVKSKLNFILQPKSEMMAVDMAALRGFWRCCPGRRPLQA